MRIGQRPEQSGQVNQQPGERQWAAVMGLNQPYHSAGPRDIVIRGECQVIARVSEDAELTGAYLTCTWVVVKENLCRTQPLEGGSTAIADS